MNRFGVTVMAALALGGTAVAATQASAMPVGALAETAAAATNGLEHVRWVCGPFRCRWQPNYGPYYGAYAWSPRPYVRPWWRGYYARPWGRRW